MKKIILVFAASLYLFPAVAQNIGINNTNPDNSAALDINGNNKGLLIPRVSLQSVSDNTTISSPATSLLVYNTNNSLSTGKGFYFNNGTSSAPLWKKFTTAADETIAFAVRGSAVTVPPSTAYVPPMSIQDFDVSGNFFLNGSLFYPNTFIAPVNGIYHFEGAITWTVNGSVSFYIYTEIRVNGSNNTSIYDWAHSDADMTTHVSNNIKLNAGDKVTLGCRHTGAAGRSVFGSFFTGYLLFRL